MTEVFDALTKNELEELKQKNESIMAVSGDFILSIADLWIRTISSSMRRNANDGNRAL